MTELRTAERYSTTAIVLHWLIAVAVVALTALGWWMQSIPKEPIGPRADAYNLHKSIGLAVLLLMAARLGWRAMRGKPQLPPLPLWQARAASTVHALLYVGMFVVAFSGYLGSATSGYPVKFFGWVIPAWAGANPMVKDACSVLHLAVSWLLVAAIGLHVIATFYHQWVLGDGLLSRMWPGRAGARVGTVRTAGD